MFGLSLWEKLSPDLKRHTAADVASMVFPRTAIGGAEPWKFRAVLATKPDWVRNELREALIATGVSPKEIEERLGF